MEHGALRKYLAKLEQTFHCPFDNSPLDTKQVEVISEEATSCWVSYFCQKCQTKFGQQVFSPGDNPQLSDNLLYGLTAIKQPGLSGDANDLTMPELRRFTNKPSVTADDVLDVRSWTKKFKSSQLTK